MKYFIFSLIFLIATPALASYPEVSKLLNAWQMQDAFKKIQEMRNDGKNESQILALEARYDFFKGNYTSALEKINQAITQRKRREWVELKSLIESTKEVTKNYTKHLSPSKKFEIWIEPGKDEVLLPYAFEALDKAYEELGKELGFYPETPIRIEVYPKTKTLAAVSPLTEKDIRTSGTIALCKYNRLMFTSPRALLRGYGWVDTMVHEYIHYLINVKTKNRVPIWMHEGLAKFLERRWRGKNKARLPIATEFLLQERVKKGSLIRFSQMHPSMAKLPSQEDTAVAFAQVFTAMEYLKNQVGEGAFRILLDHINDGMNAKQAFSKTIGVPFSTFEKEWKLSLKSRKHVKRGSGFEEKKIFRDERKKKSELDSIKEPEAKDYFRLGQMLQSRGRYKGAVVEYRNTIERIGDLNPQVQARLAQVYLEIQAPQKAIEVLTRVALRHPEYVGTWLSLGRAYNQLKKFNEAKIMLLEAARINPFDPAVHEELARAFKNLGNTREAEREQAFLTLLR